MLHVFLRSILCTICMDNGTKWPLFTNLRHLINLYWKWCNMVQFIFCLSSRPFSQIPKLEWTAWDNITPQAIINFVWCLLLTVLLQARFCGVVVITSALHAEGREFEPRQNLLGFVGQKLWLTWYSCPYPYEDIDYNWNFYILTASNITDGNHDNAGQDIAVNDR